MLACIAGADAKIDAVEWAAFLDAVARCSESAGELVREVLTERAAEPRSGADTVPAGDPLAGLAEVRGIVRAWPAEGLGLRTALMEIGATIAASSGRQLTMTYAVRQASGGGWRLSSGTSPAERAAMDAAAVVLDLAVTLEEAVDADTRVSTS
jgi:hypothetical protein